MGKLRPKKARGFLPVLEQKVFGRMRMWFLCEWRPEAKLASSHQNGQQPQTPLRSRNIGTVVESLRVSIVQLCPVPVICSLLSKHRASLLNQTYLHHAPTSNLLNFRASYIFSM